MATLPSVATSFLVSQSHTTTGVTVSLRDSLPAPTSGLTFGHVEIEKVTVEGSLHTASHDCYPVIEVLHEVAIAPVDDVERPIAAEGKEVMGGDGFRFSSLRYHVQLRHDGH